MNMTWDWKSGDLYATIGVTEGITDYSGSAVFYIKGERFGPFNGGRYGIGTEFKDKDQALRDLAIFLFWEVDKHEFEGKQEFLEMIAKGESTAKSSFLSATHDPVDDLLIDLKKGSELLEESIQELISVQLIVGDQLDLFGGLN